MSCKIELSPTIFTCNILDCLKQIFQFIHSVGYASKDSIVIAPYPTNLPTEFATDITCVKESLFCLVSNASKYTIGEVESIQFSIKMVVTNGIEFVKFGVQDSGKALPRRKLRGIFKTPEQRTCGSIGGI